MKKISLFLTACLVIALVACNNEETTNFGNDAVLQKSGDDLEGLYYKMINSQSYISEQTAIKQFVTQMNYTGDFSIFRDETTMLTWISGNIGTTSFPTYQNAVDQWDNILTLGYNTFIENEGFHIAVGNNPGRFPQFVFPFEPPVAVTECEECAETLKTCTASANTSFANTTQSLDSSLKAGKMTLEQHTKKMTIAETLKDTQIDACGISFLTCCYGPA